MALLLGAAESCVEVLNDSQTDRTLSPRVRLELGNVLVRFRIWTGNVGVFAPEAASLDSRLRDDYDVAEILLSMLRRLRSSLELALNPPLLEEAEEDEDDDSGSATGGAYLAGQGRESDEREDSSDGSSSSLRPDSEAEHSDGDSANSTAGISPADSSVKKANRIIDSLYRMVSVVRKPVSSSENAKVRDFIAKMRDRGEVEELDDVEDHVRSHLEAHFAKASKTLVERLVTAAVFRRMKLLYRRRHQQKLRQGFGPTPSQPLPQEGSRSELGPDNKQSRLYEVAPRRVKPGRGAAPSRIMSATDASSVNRPRLANYAKSVALSSITRAAVDRRQRLDVPAPPSKGADDFHKSECPFCFRIVGEEETEEPRWT